MLPDASSRTGRGARGQALVEFVLIIPILFFIAVAIGDFGRIYVSAVAVESGAREAADYGAFTESNWCLQPVPAGPCEPDPAKNNIANTEAEMQRRACTAVKGLPDYFEPPGANGSTCSTEKDGVEELIFSCGGVSPGTCALEDAPYTPRCDLSAAGCVKIVHVIMTYTFHLALKFPPFPETVTIVRESRFAISELPVGQ